MSERCSAKNRNGERCGAWAARGEAKCTLHSHPEKAAEMGAKHGRQVIFPPRTDPLDLQYRSLKSAEEICEFVEETLNRVRDGSLDVRRANTVGYLAGIQLKALAQRTAPESENSEPFIYMSLFQLGGAPGRSFPSIPGDSTTRSRHRIDSFTLSLNLYPIFRRHQWRILKLVLSQLKSDDP